MTFNIRCNNILCEDYDKEIEVHEDNFIIRVLDTNKKYFYKYYHFPQLVCSKCNHIVELRMYDNN